MLSPDRTILLIGNFIPHYQGSYSVGEALANALISQGLSVQLTSRQPVKILRLLDMLATIWRFRRVMDLALVELYSGPAFIWAEACCGFLTWLRKPFILTLHGGKLPAFAQQNPRRVRRLLRSAVTVTAPSAYLQQALNPFQPDIRWIPNPLALNDYPFKAHYLPEPRLVWLRAFHHIYHPSLAVKVLAHLLPNFPSIHLLMVGPDKGDGSLQETQHLASDLGVQDRLQILGAVPKQEVPSILQRGDIFLNTTNFDNTPVSVLEAMACGLGVVSTNVGGLPYLLEHEVDSLLVPPDQPTLMARAVQRLLNEPGLSARLTQNARRKVEQFDWEFVLPQWLEMIEKTRLQS